MNKKMSSHVISVLRLCLRNRCKVKTIKGGRQLPYMASISILGLELLTRGSENKPSNNVQQMGITAERANEYFEKSGQIVREKKTEIKIQGDEFENPHPLVTSTIGSANLPYTLDDFQKISLSALASGMYKTVLL